MSFSIKGYMCKVDFEWELGEAAGACTLYGTLEQLKDSRPCVKQCGIVEVYLSTSDYRLVEETLDVSVLLYKPMLMQYLNCGNYPLFTSFKCLKEVYLDAKESDCITLNEGASITIQDEDYGNEHDCGCGEIDCQV